jgi:hypothetical protein
MGRVSHIQRSFQNSFFKGVWLFVLTTIDGSRINKPRYTHRHDSISMVNTALSSSICNDLGIPSTVPRRMICSVSMAHRALSVPMPVGIDMQATEMYDLSRWHQWPFMCPRLMTLAHRPRTATLHFNISRWNPLFHQCPYLTVPAGQPSRLIFRFNGTHGLSYTYVRWYLLIGNKHTCLDSIHLDGSYSLLNVYRW